MTHAVPEESQKAPPARVVVSGVTKSYAGGSEAVLALEDFSLKLGPQEFVTVVGPSGCGKTTLLKMLAGLIKPTSGAMSIDGREVTGPDPSMALVFQSPTLLPWESVLQNVLLPVSIHGRNGARGAQQRATELLEMADIGDFSNRYPAELSGGMQQRVAICRALMCEPTLLLMDEPFGALDAMTREQMNVALLRIWTHAKTTVLLITHSISEAVFLADRVVVMTARPGRIREVVDIDVPRPRQLSMLGEPLLGNYAKRVRTLLELPDAQ